MLISTARFNAVSDFTNSQIATASGPPPLRLSIGTRRKIHPDGGDRSARSARVSSGPRRWGIYKDKSGALRQAKSEGEVIVASGALVTPKILMLSGIGPASHLAAHGIACLVDSPGVGQNLIDHPEVPITAIANGPFGYHKQGEGWRMLRNGLQFKLFGTGPVTSAGVEAGAYVNPRHPDAPPSIQAFCVPIVYLDRDALDLVKDGFGVTVTTVVVKPRSRGEVRLASADPSEMPLVSPNLLRDAADMQEMVDGQRFFLRAFEQKPLADRLRQIVIPLPGDRSDAALQAHCRRFVKTNTIPWARQNLALTAMIWPCLTHACACEASRGCACATCRRCPTSLRETLTRQP